MKKFLLLLMFICTMCITQAQNEGYSWTFGAAPPYTSVPAFFGSAGSYTLGLLGDDPGLLVHAPETVGLGTSCTTPYNVTEFGVGGTLFGLDFPNAAPQVVTTTYTIEMAVRFPGVANYRKVLGFNDLTAAGGDDGVYITPDLPGINPGDNLIVFRVGGIDSYISGTTIDPDIWYSLTFVRNSAGAINVYINGAAVEDGTYDDTAGDFIPKAANANKIHFFRDNDVLANPFEEAGGKVAKISIYNFELNPAQRTKTFNNVCTAAFQLATEGYQWTFAATPLNSVAATAGSTGSYELTTSGLGTLTTGVDENIALGSSCSGLTEIGTYTLDFGLDFSNDPRFVFDNYTIEMAVNIANIAAPRRLISFVSLGGPKTDNGVFVDEFGDIDFVEGVTHNKIVGSPLTENTWYHLTFTRIDGVISYYKNGVLVGTFTDTNDEFIPQIDNFYAINFLKDDDGLNESSGKIAKIGIFDYPLESFDIVERYNNICNANLVILPVDLKSFTAVKNGSQVDLTWITASEQDNRGFEIERSNNGHDFSTVGFVNGKGTTSLENTYHFTDLYPIVGKNYYRLRQIDIDNKSTYSEVRSVEVDKADGPITLFPNPGRSSITVRNIKNGSHLAIYNIQGDLLLRRIVNNYQESIAIDKLAAGVYIMQITDRDNNKKTIRFSKF